MYAKSESNESTKINTQTPTGIKLKPNPQQHVPTCTHSTPVNSTLRVILTSLTNAYRLARIVDFILLRLGVHRVTDQKSDR